MYTNMCTPWTVPGQKSDKSFLTKTGIFYKLVKLTACPLANLLQDYKNIFIALKSARQEKTTKTSKTRLLSQE